MPYPREVTLQKRMLGEEGEKLLDYQEWERLGDQARFQAAWDLVVMAYQI